MVRERTVRPSMQKLKYLHCRFRSALESLFSTRNNHVSTNDCFETCSLVASGAFTEFSANISAGYLALHSSVVQNFKYGRLHDANSDRV